MTAAAPARTDAHRPSIFDPADYSWVGYSEDSERPITDGPLFRQHDPAVDGPVPLDKDAPVNAIHPGGCDMCGHRPLTHRYFYRHNPTGEIIVLGWDCSEKAGFDNREALDARKRAEETAAKRKAQTEMFAWIEANPEASAFLADAVSEKINVGRSIEFLADLHSKLTRYGSLSEKQAEAILNVKARQAEFEAKRAAEPDPVEIPEALVGPRVTVTGKVLSAKWKDDPQFGGSYKLVVLDDRGFKVWGTAPSGLKPELDLDLDDLVDAKVSFDAKLVASDRDPCFGFFKRPTKATIIGEEG